MLLNAKVVNIKNLRCIDLSAEVLVNTLLYKLLFQCYADILYFSGAVAADGRIEPGDMLLQVNKINFENMSNEEAVRELRGIVHKPGLVLHYFIT